MATDVDIVLQAQNLGVAYIGPIEKRTEEETG